MTGSSLSQVRDEAPGSALAALEAENAALRRALADRAEELHATTRRFETALARGGVTLFEQFEQDGAFRYTWLFNSPFDYGDRGMVGLTETDFVPADMAENARALQREALATGQPQRRELHIGPPEDRRWFELRVEPTVLEDGRRGVVGAASEITAQKRQQERLQEVTRELNHRSKNLLTIVQSVARQTAVGLDVPKAFLTRLEERLQALAHAHDILVQEEWRGADLRAVAEVQLSHHLQAGGERIRIEGDRFELEPRVAHYVGLAIHELGSNAAKYGALSNDEGGVEISWVVRADGNGSRRLHLVWRERGGPRVLPSARIGFGRTILETLVPRAMRGESILDLGEEGATWSLTAPLPA